MADETTTNELIELRRIRDRYMRLLTNERVRHDRDTAAIRRAAIDWASRHGDWEAARRIEDATRPITSLLWRISQLGARPKPTAIEDLKSAARLAEGEINCVKQARDELDDTRRTRGMRDEIMRLRRHIEASGRALHRHLHGDTACATDPDSLNHCAGCRMIIDMDLGQPVERRGDPAAHHMPE